jgi:hypothetical protein
MSITLNEVPQETINYLAEWRTMKWIREYNLAMKSLVTQIGEFDIDRLRNCKAVNRTCRIVSSDLNEEYLTVCFTQLHKNRSVLIKEVTFARYQSECDSLLDLNERIQKVVYDCVTNAMVWDWFNLCYKSPS